jgi:hypothetical protein
MAAAKQEKYWLVSRLSIVRERVPGPAAEAAAGQGQGGPCAGLPAARAQAESQPLQAIETVAPLVGREEELETLLRLGRQVVSRGRARWAYLWGEPGIGKSRLTSEVAAQLESQGWQVVVASCQMHTRHAVRVLARAVAGVAPHRAGRFGGGGLAEDWRCGGAHRRSTGPFAPLLAELLSCRSRILRGRIDRRQRAPAPPDGPNRRTAGCLRGSNDPPSPV